MSQPLVTHRLSAESISPAGMDSPVKPANDEKRKRVMLNLIQHPFRRTNHLTDGSASGMDAGSSPA
jgi:hypothetical protein